VPGILVCLQVATVNCVSSQGNSCGKWNYPSLFVKQGLFLLNHSCCSMQEHCYFPPEMLHCVNNESDCHTISGLLWLWTEIHGHCVAWCTGGNVWNLIFVEGHGLQEHDCFLHGHDWLLHCGIIRPNEHKTWDWCQTHIGSMMRQSTFLFLQTQWRIVLNWTHVERSIRSHWRHAKHWSWFI